MSKVHLDERPMPNNSNRHSNTSQHSNSIVPSHLQNSIRSHLTFNYLESVSMGFYIWRIYMCALSNCASRLEVLNYNTWFLAYLVYQTKEPYTIMLCLSSSLVSSCIGISICAHLPLAHG